MITALSAIGGAFSIVAGLLLFAVAVSDWRTRERRESMEKAIARRLKGCAIWFSEDMPTMNLILGLAQGSDVSALRDEWRRERAKKEKPDEE